ncbi:MAG: serine hydrolase [Cyanobacteria bacterium K_DeepCast_35m_m2_023]|nr:serine hydrolase [Cyanobacteria bacterium K_DeepCast_35m_m2_023]
MTSTSASLSGASAEFRELDGGRYRIKLKGVDQTLKLINGSPHLKDHQIPIEFLERGWVRGKSPFGQVSTFTAYDSGGTEVSLKLRQSKPRTNDNHGTLTLRAKVVAENQYDPITGSLIKNIATGDDVSTPTFSNFALRIRDWDPSFPDAVASSFQEALDDTRQQLNFPGAIAGVWNPTGSWVGTTGLAGIDLDRAPTPADHSRIGSVTKTFTVMSLLQQVDRGLVSLDDPIGNYVEGVPNGDTATLRMLATMTSGIPNYEGLASWQADYLSDPSTAFSPKQLIDYIKGEQALFAAGSEYNYSNSNTVLLGMVIERVTGKNLSKVFENDLLKPLGLEQTFYPGQSVALPKPHLNGVTLMQDGMQTDTTYWNPSWSSAAGEMISQIRDLHTWGEVVGTGGRLISKALQRQRMQSVANPSEEGFAYGLGLFNQGGWLGHNGSLPGFTSYLAYEPRSQTVIAVMANSDIHEAGTPKPADVVFAALQQLVPEW